MLRRRSEQRNTKRGVRFQKSTCKLIGSRRFNWTKELYTSLFDRIKLQHFHVATYPYVLQIHAIKRPRRFLKATVAVGVGARIRQSVAHESSKRKRGRGAWCAHDIAAPAQKVSANRRGVPKMAEVFQSCGSRARAIPRSQSCALERQVLRVRVRVRAVSSGLAATGAAAVASTTAVAVVQR